MPLDSEQELEYRAGMLRWRWSCVAPLAAARLCGCSLFESVEGKSGPGEMTDYASTVLADGPISYWRLHEVAPALVAKDATGRHDGTIVGKATFGVPGAIAGDSDTALRFEGAGYIDIGDVRAFDFEGMAPFTLEMWLKPTYGYVGCPLSKNVFEDGRRIGYHIVAATRAPDAGPAYLQYQRSAPDLEESAPTGPLDPNIFSHVVVTLGDPPGTIRLYVNSVIVRTVESKLPLEPRGLRFAIGADQQGKAYLFAGDIDEVAVYDYALPPARVAAHYAKATGAP